MRILGSLLAALALVAVLLVTPRPPTTYAAFHCMRIHAVLGGFSGNNNIQYVELRMDYGGFPQRFVGGHIIEFRDTAGALLATFTFPADVTNGNLGSSILIATSEFNTNATGGTADFVFTTMNTSGVNVTHPIPATGGKVIFAPGTANCSSTAPVDSVAYGGAPADYGTAAGALPSPSNNQALRLSTLNQNPNNNSAEYSLQAVSTITFSVSPGNLPSDFNTPRNNAGTVLKLALAAPAVGGEIIDPGDTGATEAVASTEAGDDHATRNWSLAVAAIVLPLAAGGAWFAWRRRGWHSAA